MKLLVILASTRPGRVGPAVARWGMRHPKAAELFDDIELVDLADLDLPLLDEPHLPRAATYTREHTHRWSAIVAPADAFLIVTPEYNLAPPPSLVNALDYLHHEWRWKAAAMLSYGGVAGGARSAQIVKQMLGAMNCFTVHEAVNVTWIWEKLGERGEFQPPHGAAEAANLMFDSLAALARALRTVRVPDGVSHFDHPPTVEPRVPAAAHHSAAQSNRLEQR